MNFKLLSELIKHFGIDWKLLLAQAVNFFILFFLLKKFAYQPILKMLKRRREDIEKGVKFSQEVKEKMEKIEEFKEKTLNTANTQALVIVNRAEEIGKIRKDEIIQEANKKVETIVTDAKKIIEEEKSKMGDEIYKNAQMLIKLGLEKVIGKMPAGERDKNLIEEALKELKGVKL